MAHAEPVSPETKDGGEYRVAHRSIKEWSNAVDLHGASLVLGYGFGETDLHLDGFRINGLRDVSVSSPMGEPIELTIKIVVKSLNGKDYD